MENLKNYIMYFIAVGILFLFLFFSVRIFERKNNLIFAKVYALVNQYETITINDKDKNINISYPKFGYDSLDLKVKEFITDYSQTDGVNIQYSLNVGENIISMFFVINLNDEIHYKNINYNLKSSSFISNQDMIDFNVIRDVVLNKVKDKYSTDIYNSVVEDNFNNIYLKVENEGIYFYFDNGLFTNLLHKVFVFIKDEKSSVDASSIVYDKIIAFTFDDGPSQYTKDMVNTLRENDSKATFFELGNRMKYNQDIVKYVYDNGMEVASHTYAHKNLNRLNDNEIDEEINSTNIIFNEITGSAIKYLRPPYGNANEKVKSRVGMPIITWNVDTEDWVSRNSEKVYNHILENVSDGDIVLMHDIYPETLEAVKKVLPVLRERGFKITTVSELANEKGKVLENGHVYRSFK